jgi:eukaryotic-like serine/threonine-protein kinase
MADIPEKIGKYEVLDVAGKGAMGTVYVGHDPFIDRPVAIKVCLSKVNEDMGELARRMFFNEAQSAGALDHPNILRIYDAGEEDGEPYIVMEYVAGGATLQSFCNPEDRLPVETIVAHMHQCAKALDYAHRRKVLHRDIKPANIMLTESGEIKLGDFGIAQRLLPDKTQLLSTFGSPRYMSPEQAQDEKLSEQSDLYSFGVSMYELLAGQAPFTARSLPQLVNFIINRDPQPLRELRPEVPEALEKIVSRAMAKSRADRYLCAAEIAADLATVYDSAAPSAPPELDEEEQFNIARKLAFFNDFSDSELEEVLAVATWHPFTDGQRIISEGETDQSFHVIARGDVDIMIADKRISSLSRGECIGEIGYLSKVNRIASAVACGEVMTLRIDEMHMEWASLPCQLRFNKVFQKVLIERLSSTTRELARFIR